MRTLKHLPASSTELLDELNKRFPARCIAPDEELFEAHRYAAKRELIDWLLELQKKEA